MLLNSEVVVLLRETTAPASGSGLELMTWMRDDGVEVVPFFSSIEVCKQVASGHGPSAIVPARSFFQGMLAYSMPMHLNPNYSIGRGFLPAELDSLLTLGTIHSGMTSTVVEHEITMVMRVPQDDLSGLQTALTSLLTSSRHAEAAYLFEVERSDSPGLPSLMLEIAGPRDEALLHAIGTVVVETYSGRLPLDVHFIGTDDIRLAPHYREAIAPFFVRSWTELPHQPPLALQ
jgi:hypothetical protein